jgi:replicative DNA helicase Mcm
VVKKPVKTVATNDSDSDVIREVWRNAISKGEDKDLCKQIEEQKDIGPFITLTFDLEDLSETHKEEYDALTTKVVESVDMIKEILTNKKEQAYNFEEVVISIENFNTLNGLIPKKKIRQLRSEDIGKLIVFDGLVKNSSGVEPKLNLVAFSCGECGCISYDVQEGNVEDISAVTCAYCGALRESLTRLEDRSVFINFMKCDVEEDPEGLKGHQPERIPCEFAGPLTTEEKRVGVGERTTLIGIYKAREKAKGSLIYQGFVDVLGAVKRGKNYEELEVSPDDEKKFLEMADDKDLLLKITKAVAPNISGHDVEKSAIALQMVGGNLEAGDRRGNIHILLIGDPGVGKSKMVRNIIDIAPHVVKASGAPTTTVGLTACIVKDEDTPGGFILEAGAAVLADGGLLVVDGQDRSWGDA